MKGNERNNDTMSTATMPQTAGPSLFEEDIFSKATCLSVELGSLGSKRKVNSSQVSVDADKELISVSKTLLESPELLAVKQLLATVRQYLYSRTVRTTVFRSGIYVLPLVLVDETDQQLLDYAAELRDLVEALLVRYGLDDSGNIQPGSLIAKDQERLRSVFNLKDYPPPAKIREACYISWNYIKFGTPDNLPDAIRAREVEKDSERVLLAANQFEQLLRAEMLDLVAHIEDRLGVSKDGKPKIFRDSLVSTIKDFVALASARNLTNDAELDRLCRQAAQLLDGVDPKLLRENAAAREGVRAGFAQIKAELDTLVVVDRPRRQIDLEREE